MSGRLLIVDDEPSIRNILKLRLSRLGFETSEAENGRDALDLLEKNAFDTVLCDIQMPEMNGLEMIERLRVFDSMTPVIMLTGVIDLETAVEVMKKGAFDYLTKPIHVDALELAVRKAVEYKRALIRNRLLEEERAQYQKNLEIQVAEQTRIIRSMFELANRLNGLASMDDILNSLTTAICDFIPCERVWILLLEKSHAGFSHSRGKGIPSELNGNVRIPWDDALWARLFEKGSVRILNESPDDWFPGNDSRLGEILRPPLMQAPLQGPRTRLGVINLSTKTDGTPFSEEEAQILSYIADSATVAIENRFFEQRLENSYLSTIQALAKAIEAKDPYTRGHSERVANLCVRMAQVMNLSREEIRTLRFAGILHDVGKIGVPEQILTKPDRLTPEEFEVVRKHPVIGEQMVQEAEFLEEARRIIRQHHERIDGTGYPDGLKGPEICLGARIMAVADAYDAMTTDRTYRRARTDDWACEELRNLAGKQFDARCVEALFRVLESEKDRDAEKPGIPAAVS